ncbi:MAG TPA: TraB/GumN family protein [Rhizomicrobium sp.]
MSEPIPLLRQVIVLLAGLATAAPLATAAKPEVVLGQIDARPALWTVRSKTTTAYLFGSIHVLPPNMHWQTPQIEAALGKSDIFVFEAPLDEQGQTDMQAFVRAHGTLPPETSLPSLLNAAERKDYNDALAETHIPPETLTHVRPWLAGIMLEGATLQQSHYSAAGGVDRQIYVFARSRGKPVASLETIDQQMNLLMPSDSRLELKEFDATLKEMKAGTREVGALVDAWAHADVAQVAKIMNSQLDTEPETRKLFIDDRNQRWLSTLGPMLAGHQTYFITVGTGHLAGARGLPALLRSHGYAVEGP